MLQNYHNDHHRMISIEIITTIGHFSMISLILFVFLTLKFIQTSSELSSQLIRIDNDGSRSDFKIPKSFTFVQSTSHLIISAINSTCSLNQTDQFDYTRREILFHFRYEIFRFAFSIPLIIVNLINII